MALVIAVTGLLMTSPAGVRADLPFGCEEGSDTEWETSSGGNGHFYRVIDCSTDPLDWNTANAAVPAGYCLLTVTSSEENNFVYSLFDLGQQGRAYWMGAIQDPNQSEPPYDQGWSWITGEPWGSFINWDAGEPNGEDEDRAAYNWDGASQWNDASENNSGEIRGYIIERDPENEDLCPREPPHFACYAVKGDYEKRTVYIQDQFLKKYTRTTILEPELLCARAEKYLDVQETIADGDIFLTCYREKPPFSMSETVRVVDQFWDKDVRAMTPTSSLCLPTVSELNRNSVGSLDENPAEEEIDHYRCYTLRRERFKEIRNVGLVSPLGSHVVKVLEPVSLCNPTIKELTGYGDNELLHPEAHLMCYAVKVTEEESGPPAGIEVYNQFGEQYLKVKDLVRLCNPALKFHKKAF